MDEQSDRVTVAVWYEDGDEDHASLVLSTEDGRSLPVRVDINGHWPRFGRLLAMLTPHLRRDSVEPFLQQLRGAGMELAGHEPEDLQEFVAP